MEKFTSGRTANPQNYTTMQPGANSQNYTTVQPGANPQNYTTMQPGVNPQNFRAGVKLNNMGAPRILLPDYHPDDEQEYENDREYLMQMYPAKARIVMAMIENECDKLEYEQSPMYARYPDKETLLLIAAEIAGRICGGSEDEELQQLIQVLFVNECYNRRNKHRRRRRFY
jgi:hypothetical protein